jgi:hypothetical protein
MRRRDSLLIMTLKIDDALVLSPPNPARPSYPQAKRLIHERFG